MGQSGVVFLGRTLQPHRGLLNSEYKQGELTFLSWFEAPIKKQMRMKFESV